MIDLKYELGDVITSDAPASSLYKRECTVVFVDYTLIGIITDGIESIIFVEYNDVTLTVVRRGSGYLASQDKARIAQAIEKWAYKGFVTDIPNLVTKTRKRLNDEGNDKVYVKVDGFVSKEVAVLWKQFQALVDMAKMSNPEIPNYIQTSVFEWVLANALATIQFGVAFKEHEDGNKKDEGKT